MLDVVGLLLELSAIVELDDYNAHAASYISLACGLKGDQKTCYGSQDVSHNDMRTSTWRVIRIVTLSDVSNERRHNLRSRCEVSIGLRDGVRYGD